MLASSSRLLAYCLSTKGHWGLACRTVGAAAAVAMVFAPGIWAQAQTNGLPEFAPETDRVNLSTPLLQLEDYPAVVTELRRALELDPRRPEALPNPARLYLPLQTDPPEALALSKRLVAVDPGAASYDLPGWAYFVNGETYEAIAAVSEAVRKEPDNPVCSGRSRQLQQLAGTE